MKEATGSNGYTVYVPNKETLEAMAEVESMITANDKPSYTIETFFKSLDLEDE